MSHCTLSPQHRDWLTANYATCTSAEAMAELSSSWNWIKRQAQRLGLTRTIRTRVRSAWGAKRVAQLLAMHQRGDSIRSIAEALNTTTGAVYCQLRNHDTTPRRNQAPPSSPEQNQAWWHNYKRGVDAPDINPEFLRVLLKHQKTWAVCHARREQ